MYIIAEQRCFFNTFYIKYCDKQPPKALEHSFFPNGDVNKLKYVPASYYKKRGLSVHTLEIKMKMLHKH